MSFYEQIAPYYDYIFPAGPEQLLFIKNTAGDPPKKLLDIACGAGTYSVELAHDGYEVWATDVDEEMIRQTNIRAAAKDVKVETLVLNMLELDKLSEEKFDCVFCIGNSIVHLGSKDAILAAVRQMKERLDVSGSMLLQIINFDRVIKKGITALPSIINPDAGIEFHRNYSFDAATGLIGFDTVLKTDCGSGAGSSGGEGVRMAEDRAIRDDKNAECDVSMKEHANSIKLFPLVSPDLRDILERAGFGSIDFYGDFSRNTFVADESYLLVARASL